MTEYELRRKYIDLCDRIERHTAQLEDAYDEVLQLKNVLADERGQRKEVEEALLKEIREDY